MIWLLLLASPWLLGGALLAIGIVFYPFHDSMLDVLAWVVAQL